MRLLLNAAAIFAGFGLVAAFALFLDIASGLVS